MAALALAQLATPAFAADPVSVPPGMSDAPCPAPAPGQFALDETILQTDWAWQCRYRAENAKVDPANPPQIVFMGDSITENWIGLDPALFGSARLDRGISGQTSPQMLIRFWQDVIALHPRIVHIMAGTNDIAGNTGPTTPEAYKDAVRSMVMLAKANGIVVILGSIPPANRFEWSPQLRPAPWIAKLNAWLRSYAEEQDLVYYADYHAVLAGPDGELRSEYGADGVHPNAAGYAAMRPVTEAAIARAEAAAAALRAM